MTGSLSNGSLDHRIFGEEIKTLSRQRAGPPLNLDFNRMAVCKGFGNLDLPFEKN